MTYEIPMKDDAIDLEKIAANMYDTPYPIQEREILKAIIDHTLEVLSKEFDCKERKRVFKTGFEVALIIRTMKGKL